MVNEQIRVLRVQSQKSRLEKGLGACTHTQTYIVYMGKRTNLYTVMEFESNRFCLK